MDDFDVLVVGAGPAGACLAANLAPIRRVLLVDRLATPAARFGETLVPAARRLFADMGLIASFEAERHERWHANLSLWGDDHLAERSFVRDIDGHGWLLDRRRLDLWLRQIARHRGATLLAPATVHALERDGEGWRATVAVGERLLSSRARLVVDATGRRGALARKLGVRNQVFDRLMSRWVVVGARASVSYAGTTFVQAERNGWWYSAPTDVGRLIAFHTDADLPAARQRKCDGDLLSAARGAGLLARFLCDDGAQIVASGSRAAHCSVPGVVAPSNWLMIGDAAVSSDPLGARGLLTALVTALAGAEACDRHLAGVPQALEDYRRMLTTIGEAAQRERADCYASEERWADSLFWQRRRVGQEPATGAGT